MQMPFILNHILSIYMVKYLYLIQIHAASAWQKLRFQNCLRYNFSFQC